MSRDRLRQHRADRVARKDAEVAASISTTATQNPGRGGGPSERTAGTMNGQPIASTLAALERDERRDLFSQYRELLLLQGHTPQQVELLRDLMRRLGKSASDAQRDAATLERAATAAKQVDDGAGLDEEVSRLNEEIRVSAVRMNETLNRMQAEHQQRVLKVSRLSDRQDTGRRATNTLQTMLRESPELLSHLAGESR